METQGMIDSTMTRRLLVKRGGQLSLAALTLSMTACGKQAGGKLVCNDPAKDSADTKEMRASFHYVESFPEADKTCANCAFFAVGDDSKCGNCKVLQGTVNPTGHCDSFSLKT
jgi:hypothetical protein